MEEKWRILENDADLEYVVRVCNHFWPAKDKSVPSEKWEEWQEIHNMESDKPQSIVPLFFRKELENGSLLRRKEFYDNYLDAYKNHAYNKRETLQDILRRFELDSRKFWFLCLAVRRQATLYVKRLKAERHTVLEVLDDMIDAIGLIDHSKYWHPCMTPCVAERIMKDAANNINMIYQQSDIAYKVLSLADEVISGKDIKAFDEAELTLRIKKDGKTVRTVNIADDASLCAISQALKEYVQKKGTSPYMNARVPLTHTKEADTMCVILAYFTRVLEWFLGEHKKEHNITTKLYNKRDLIAHMAHILKMDGRPKDPYDAEGLKNAINKYRKIVDPYDFAIL